MPIIMATVDTDKDNLNHNVSSDEEEFCDADEGDILVVIDSDRDENLVLEVEAMNDFMANDEGSNHDSEDDADEVHIYVPENDGVAVSSEGTKKSKRDLLNYAISATTRPISFKRIF